MMSMIFLKEHQITKVHINQVIVLITWDTASQLGCQEKVKTGNFLILRQFTGEFKDRMKLNLIDDFVSNIAPYFA